MTDVAILIHSFDGYSACWVPVAHGLRKYWPDCPYPIYLTTNTKDFDSAGVSVLKLGDEPSWSTRLRLALERLDTEYVLYFQEDYWLTEPVVTATVRDYVGHMEREGFNYIRLVASPPPPVDLPGDHRLGLIARDGEYRASMQIALWRRTVLHDLLVPGESVWEFEIDGTNRSRRYGETFLSVKPGGDDPSYWGIYYLATAINAGRWAPGAREYARAEGLQIDFGPLPFETRWQAFQRARWGRSVVAVWKERLGLLVTNPKGFYRRLRSRGTKTRALR